MPLNKKQKQKIIEGLKEKIAGQKAVVFMNFSGLKVKDLFDLRKRLKTVDCRLLVAKKTLMKLAFKEAGIKVEPKEMEGEIALAFGFKDEILPAKTIYKFSQENENLKISGGFVKSQGLEFLNAEQIIELAKLPTKEELLARLVGSISAPISNFVRALNYNIKGLVYLLTTIKKT